MISKKKINKADLKALKWYEKELRLKEAKCKPDYTVNEKGQIIINPFKIHSSDGKMTACLGSESTSKDIYIDKGNKIQITFSIDTPMTKQREYLKGVNMVFRRTKRFVQFDKKAKKVILTSHEKVQKAEYGSCTSTREDIKKRNAWIKERYEELKKERPQDKYLSKYDTILDELEKKEFGNAKTQLSLERIKSIIYQK